MTAIIKAVKIDELTEGRYRHRVFFHVYGLPKNAYDLTKAFRKVMIPWANESCNGLYTIKLNSMDFELDEDMLLAKLKFI